MEKQTSNLVKLISGVVIGLAALTVVLPIAGCMGARVHHRLGRARVVIIAPGRHYPRRHYSGSYFGHYPRPSYFRHYQRSPSYFGFPQRRLPQYQQKYEQKKQYSPRPRQKRQPRRQEQRREHPRRGFGHRQQR